MAIEAEPDEDIVSDRHGRNIGSENRERERERKQNIIIALRHFTDNTGKLRPLLKNIECQLRMQKMQTTKWGGSSIYAGDDK